MLEMPWRDRRRRRQWSKEYHGVTTWAPPSFGRCLWRVGSDCCGFKCVLQSCWRRFREAGGGYEATEQQTFNRNRAPDVREIPSATIFQYGRFLSLRFLRGYPCIYIAMSALLLSWSWFQLLPGTRLAPAGLPGIPRQVRSPGPKRSQQLLM